MGPEDQRRGAHHSNSRSSKNKPSNRHDNQQQKPTAVRHYDWNSTHFFPDIHDIDIPFKRKPRSCFYNDLTWLDLPKGPSIRPQEKLPPPNVAASGANRENRNSKMVMMQDTRSDTWWGEQDIRTRDIQMRDNGHQLRRAHNDNVNDVYSSDEENRPPPERLKSSQVVEMAREAAKRRSRSMDDYLHIPHMDETESDPDSVASSPKVWRKNPLMARKVKREPPHESPKPQSVDVLQGNFTPPTTPTRWNRVDSSEFRNGHDASSGSRRSSLNESKPQSPRRLSERGSPLSRFGSQGSSPGLRRQNSDRIKEQYERFEELQQMRRALDSTTTSEESLPTLKHASNERNQEYIHIRRLSTASQDSLQRQTENVAVRQASLTRRDTSPTAGQVASHQPLVQKLSAPDSASNMRSSQGPDGFDVEEPRLSIEERKALFEKLQQPKTQTQQHVQLRHQQGSKRLSRNQERQEFEKRQSRTAFDHQSPTKPGAFDQRIARETEFKQKDRLQSSSFENIYDGVDLSHNTPEISEIEYEPRRLKRTPQNAHKRSTSGDQDKVITHRREPKIYGDNRAINKSENLNLFLSRGNEQTVFGIFGDSSLTRHGQLPAGQSHDQSRDQTISPESSSSEKRRNYDAKALIAEEKEKFAEYKAEYAKRQSSHSSDPSISEEELRASRMSPQGPQSNEGLVDVAYPMETQQLPLTTKQRWQPLSREHSPWQPSKDTWLAEPQIEPWLDYHGYRGLTEAGSSSAFHAPVPVGMLRETLDNSATFPPHPHSRHDNNVDRDAMYSHDDSRGWDRGRPSGHKHSTSEPASYADYGLNQAQPPPPPPRPQGSQGFYNDRPAYISNHDQPYSQRQPYGHQEHHVGHHRNGTHQKVYNQQKTVDSKAQHQRSTSQRQDRERPAYVTQQEGTVRDEEHKTRAGPSRGNLEQNEDYWVHQQQHPAAFINRLSVKPQSVPTSPTSDTQHYNTQHHLTPNDDNVRSSSAEGYHQERWWTQGHGYGQSHFGNQGQPQGQRRNSWDRFQQESGRDPHDYIYSSGHQGESSKSRVWKEASNATSTQPHGWGAPPPSSPHHRTPSPHHQQHGSPHGQFSSSIARPELIQDWSYNARYEPHSGPASINAPFTAQQTLRAHDKSYTKPHRLSTNDPVFSDGYPSLGFQQKDPYVDGWVVADLGPYTGEAKSHVDQYNFQSYKNSAQYATTLDQQFKSQQNVVSAPPRKPERLHLQRKSDQLNREYDIYADPNQVRQMKTAHKSKSVTKSGGDKRDSDLYSNDWSLPKSADELRKQFTSNIKERSEMYHNQEKYTKFFVTASPEPTSLSKTDAHNQRVSQHLNSGHDSLSSHDNSLGSGPKIEKLIADIRHKYEQQRESSPKPRKKTQHQFDMKTEHPSKRPAYCIKADEQPEKPTPVNLGAIKANLFGLVGEKQSTKSSVDEKNRVKSNLKVSEIKTEVFNARNIMSSAPQPRPSSKHFNEADKDQRLLTYASYRDSLKPRRSKIEDELTDLERTYEQLNLNDEDAWERALRHEAATVQCEDDLKKVRRLSITNLRKLETMQQNEGKPSLDYTRTWLANEASSPRILDSTVFPAKNHDEAERPEVFTQAGKGSPESAEVSRYASQSQAAVFETSIDKRILASSGHRLSSSLPLKVGDDMAHRRVRGTSSSGNSKPGSVGVGSYLASPGITPATSIDSINRRPHPHRSRRSTTPDIIYDDMAMRNRLRVSSAGDGSPVSVISPSPTSADYLKPRETAPARGRMRLRPDPQADKYHDDFAYRQLRKDVAPVKAELPKAFIEMKRQLQLHPRRTQSLDRVNQEPEDRHAIRKPHRRSASIGDNQSSFERRASLSKGIAKMMDLFDASENITSSAPDLTNESAFKDAYNDRGDIVLNQDEAKEASQQISGKQAAKQLLKQQTPRIVKQRNEYKSRMKSQSTHQTQRSESQSYTESESDTYSSTYSSSGDRQNRSPPDGATHSDETATQRNQETTTPSSDNSHDNNQTQVKKQWLASHPQTRVTSQLEISAEHNINTKANVKTVQISLAKMPYQSSADPQKSSDQHRTAHKIVNTVSIPVTRKQSQSSAKSQDAAKVGGSTRSFEMNKSIESSCSSGRTFSIESQSSSEHPQLYMVPMVPLTPTTSDSLLSPLLVQSSGQSSSDQTISTSKSSISKEAIHIHKVGSTSVGQEQKPMTVNIVQTESRIVQNKTPELDTNVLAQKCDVRVMVKQQAERIEQLGQNKDNKPSGRAVDIKESMTVLEQWKAQAVQKKRELQECLEREIQEEKERARKQRHIYELEVMSQSQVTKTERKVPDKTKKVLQEKREVKTITQAKKLETQQLILKGQNKILAHRGLLPKKVDTLDDLVASQPIASDFELEFSDYDNIETSDPEVGNATESDDSQKGLHEKNKRIGKSVVAPKSAACGLDVGSKQEAVKRTEKENLSKEGIVEPPQKQQQIVKQTEVMHIEQVETTTSDGATKMSEQTTIVEETISSGNKTDANAENVDDTDDCKPRLGRRPSFKDIVNSFEAKAPTFMRKPALRRCSSQDSVQQDDPQEGATESWRLRDISGSEPNLRDSESQRLKYHRVGGYYAELGSHRDPVSEF